MKFELLPNEIFIECFEYFNPFEIFHSFHQLNNRFDQLIYNIPLYLNFQHVRKSIFDQFCTKMRLNPKIKNQIHSLYLSKDDCGQIEIFLSFFSINEFPHLQSLTLIDFTHYYEGKLQSALPLLSELLFHHIVSPSFVEEVSLGATSIAKSKTLPLPSVSFRLTLNNRTSFIKSLTISSCSVMDLIDILKSMTILNYLRIQTVSKPLQSINNISHRNDHYGVCLKQLILLEFESGFEELELLLQHTPNIRSLTISNYNESGIIDASRWEYLIKSTLTNLNIFKFQFDYYYGDGDSTSDEESTDDEDRTDGEDSSIVEKFKRFQTSFWCEEHHWYTEYILKNGSARIYTVPYMLKKYELKSTTKRYYGELTNNANPFDNVTDLILDSDVINEKCDYKFSNVKSLTFCNVTSLTISDEYLTTEHMESLKRIVNLFNLKHLDVSEGRTIASSTVLLEILKEAPQLSSMAINPGRLISLCDDNIELGNCLNKMIKKLSVDCTYFSRKSDFLEQKDKFCRIFSNLEQLIYITRGEDEREDCDMVLYLLNHLSKLSRLDTYIRPRWNFRRWCFSRFKNEAKNLNIIYHIESYYNSDYDVYEDCLQIWTG
jgi:hypothetical protein